MYTSVRRLTTAAVLAAAAAAIVAASASVGAQATPAAQGPGTGVLAGKANDEAKKPYTDYRVQIRNVESTEVVRSVALDNDARFQASELTTPNHYLVELVNTKDNKIVCTEGPYLLVAPSLLAKTDININCGTNPAVWWLLLAGVGAALLVALAQASASK